MPKSPGRKPTYTEYEITDLLVETYLISNYGVKHRCVVRGCGKVFEAWEVDPDLGVHGARVALLGPGDAVIPLDNCYMCPEHAAKLEMFYHPESTG